MSTWDACAQHKVEMVNEATISTNTSTILTLRHHVDNMIDTLFHDSIGYGTIPFDEKAYAYQPWLELGSLAFKNDCGYHFTVGYVTEVLCSKQRDYGPKNISRFGIQGLLIRVHDKVARLENLLNNSVLPNNESISDTFLDIVGYAVIALMWIDGEFLLPMSDI